MARTTDDMVKWMVEEILLSSSGDNRPGLLYDLKTPERFKTHLASNWPLFVDHYKKMTTKESSVGVPADAGRVVELLQKSLQELVV